MTPLEARCAMASAAALAPAVVEDRGAAQRIVHGCGERGYRSGLVGARDEIDAEFLKNSVSSVEHIDKTGDWRALISADVAYAGL